MMLLLNSLLLAARYCRCTCLYCCVVAGNYPTPAALLHTSDSIFRSFLAAVNITSACCFGGMSGELTNMQLGP